MVTVTNLYPSSDATIVRRSILFTFNCQKGVEVQAPQMVYCKNVKGGGVIYCWPVVMKIPARYLVFADTILAGVPGKGIGVPH